MQTQEQAPPSSSPSRAAPGAVSAWTRAARWCGPLGRAALLLGAACWVVAP